MTERSVAACDVVPVLETRSYRFRLVSTGFCFLMFWLGAVAFAATVVILRLTVWDRERRLALVQRLLGTLMRFFRSVITRLGLIRIRIDGLTELLHAEPSIVVCNHPTLIDAPLLLSLLPKLCCVVKGELADSWAYRTVIHQLGFLTIGSSEHPVERCVEAVRSGRSILIFPEGTRSPADGLHSFARGAVSIALRSGAPLLPIVLLANPPSLGKGQRWYEIPPHPIDFSISIRYPFLSKTCPVDRASERELSLKLTGELEEYFKRAIFS
ncbi:MAG: lysophospholipid acyltransferase family protein [Bdellovibrionota bacterium]